jgi:hypothetical protein
VKLAGRSEVTVVWASALLPAVMANVEIKAATSEAAKRCDDIMTYLARIPRKEVPDLQQEFAQNFRSEIQTGLFGMKPRHRTPRPRRRSSRRREKSLTIRHT